MLTAALKPRSSFTTIFRFRTKFSSSLFVFVLLDKRIHTSIYFHSLIAYNGMYIYTHIHIYIFVHMYVVHTATIVATVSVAIVSFIVAACHTLPVGANSRFIATQKLHKYSNTNIYIYTYVCNIKLLQKQCKITYSTTTKAIKKISDFFQNYFSTFYCCRCFYCCHYSAFVNGVQFS